MQTGVKLFIAIPSMSYIHTFLVDRLITWTINPNVRKMFYFTANVQPVDRAREQIVDEFLKTDCTHLLMIDDDTIPPEDAIDKMVALNKDIVTALTPMVRFSPNTKEYYREYNAVGINAKHLQPNMGVVECLGAGGACLLIKRIVAEKTPRPLFRNMHQDDTGKETFISEDVYFITKARKNGFSTFADTSIVCWHSKETLW